MKTLQRFRDIAVAITTGLLLLFLNSVYADNAATLFELIIDILGKIFLAVGAFLGIMGIAHYAIANGDGDGPAKRRATMEMASGVAVIVVSIVLISSKSTLVSIIAT